MSNIALYDLTRQGRVYHASTQAGVTTSALSTTATGLILTNPYGSGKNLSVVKIVVAQTTAPGGASVLGVAMSPAISATAVTQGTPLSVRSGILNGTAGNSVGLAASAATTVGTPVFVRALGGPVAASSITPPFIVDYTDGDLVLVPGTSIQIAHITTAAVVFASITWVEYDPSTVTI